MGLSVTAFQSTPSSRTRPTTPGRRSSRAWAVRPMFRSSSTAAAGLRERARLTRGLVAIRATRLTSRNTSACHSRLWVNRLAISAASAPTANQTVTRLAVASSTTTNTASRTAHSQMAAVVESRISMGVLLSGGIRSPPFYSGGYTTCESICSGNWERIFIRAAASFRPGPESGAVVCILPDGGWEYKARLGQKLAVFCLFCEIFAGETPNRSRASPGKKQSPKGTKVPLRAQKIVQETGSKGCVSAPNTAS